MKLNHELNHEFTVINHIFWKAESNFTSHTEACLVPDLLNQKSIKYLAKDLEQQDVMLRSKDFPKQTRNKLTDVILESIKKPFLQLLDLSSNGENLEQG